MNRNTLNYLIDLLLFVLLGAVVFIGVLLKFFIPAGRAYEETSKFFWGLHRHDWGDIHLILGVAILALVIVHILLHWSWIKATTLRIFGRTWALLLVIIVAGVIGLLLLGWAVYPRQETSAKSSEPKGRQYRGGRNLPIQIPPSH